MKTLMKVLKTENKTLASGDKSMRITLETLFPEEIPKLSSILAPKVEIEVEFKED